MLPLLRLALEKGIAQEDWEAAANRASNLSELLDIAIDHLSLGRAHLPLVGAQLVDLPLKHPGDRLLAGLAEVDPLLAGDRGQPAPGHRS